MPAKYDWWNTPQNEYHDYRGNGVFFSRRNTGERCGPVYTDPCPDYLADLNAIHRAVATLTREQYDADEGFSYWLARVVHGLDADGIEVGWNFYEMQEATAAQRAEAFLKTLGLWQDTPEKVEL